MYTYLCSYIYTYIHIYICIYVYIYTYMYTYIFSTNTLIYVCTYKNIHVDGGSSVKFYSVQFYRARNIQLYES